jgi:hypothetical protein
MTKPSGHALAYPNSVTDRPLSAAEEETARRLVQAEIDAEGYHFVRKSIGLVTARR